MASVRISAHTHQQRPLVQPMSKVISTFFGHSNKRVLPQTIRYLCVNNGEIFFQAILKQNLGGRCNTAYKAKENKHHLSVTLMPAEMNAEHSYSAVMKTSKQNQNQQTGPNTLANLFFFQPTIPFIPGSNYSLSQISVH